MPPSPSTLSPVKPDRVGDRFIPSRAGARWHIDFNMMSDKGFGRQPVNKSAQQSTQNQQPPHSSQQQPSSQTSSNQNRKNRDANENGKGTLPRAAWNH